MRSQAGLAGRLARLMGKVQCKGQSPYAAIGWESRFARGGLCLVFILTWASSKYVCVLFLQYFT